MLRLRHGAPWRKEGMQRAITGYHRDDEGHWVAQLDCGHGQHVRHDPPFTSRPWVTTPEGRASRLGFRLGCVRCDRRELPEPLDPLETARELGEGPLPAWLEGTRTHPTGVWLRLQVRAGRLRVRLGAPFDVALELGPGEAAAVPPGVSCAVAPFAGARFGAALGRTPWAPPRRAPEEEGAG